MSLTIAQRHAWSLARTLMVCITLFHAGNGYGAVPTSEFDGDADSIVHEYDPDTRDHVSKILRAAGHVIDACANGPDAIFLGTTNNYAVLILDRMVPGVCSPSAPMAQI